MVGGCDPTWTILYKKEKTSETLAFFLDVATTEVFCVKNNIMDEFFLFLFTIQKIKKH